MPPLHWDIFCNVIDNYGDIGVAWRLARQLANEHAANVTLWVDDLASFARIAPGLTPTLTQQALHGITIRHWPATGFPEVTAADIVIEAFGCRLPERYEQAMTARARRPVWINLEYLSAEDWVAGCHALASPHPRLPLTKHFFFPGFDSHTGGLLREGNLARQRDEWQHDTAAQDRYWHALGIPPRQPEEWRISLFCYESMAARDWLQACTRSTRPLRLLVPQGKVLPDIAAALGHPGTLQAGDCLQQGALGIHVLPLTDQAGYDRLLWSCDINIVRGEDSLVRALWAGKPFLWHIYRQQEAAHLVKLDAFLQRYLHDATPALASAVTDMWQHWNGEQAVSASWQALQTQYLAWQQHAAFWSQKQRALPDLATRLVQFAQIQLQ